MYSTRKIALSFFIVYLIFCLIPAISLAKLGRTVDQFDGVIKIESEFSKNTGVFSKVTLTKFIKRDGEVSYAIYPGIVSREWWFFSEHSTELKIDDDPNIYMLDVLTTKSDISEGYYSHSLITLSCIDVKPEIVDLLKNAKKATFRIYFTNQPATIWELPPQILSEWQQVINTVN